MNRMLNIPLGIKNYGEGGLIADTSIIDEKESVSYTHLDVYKRQVYKMVFLYPTQSWEYSPSFK